MEQISVESLTELHHRKSAKWRMLEPDILPMGLAEMDFSVAEPIRTRLINMINGSDLGYGGFAPELGEAFSGFAKRRWGWEPDPAQCWPVTDVAVAGMETLRRLCAAGSKVGISTPVYYNFKDWIAEIGFEVTDIPLMRNDDFTWCLDLAALEIAFSEGLPAYILCNPHNPVGYLPSRTELEQLADLADEYNVLIISDEIHAPLTYPGNTFTPYLSINAQAKRTGVMITSASKAWNTAGLKCAQIITQDEQRSESLKFVAEHTIWRSSLLGAWANITAYNEGEPWLDQALELLDVNRRLLASLLSDLLPEANYRIPNSTYLGWVDLSAYHEKRPAQYLREQARVAFSEGEDFGPSGAGFVRIDFATSSEILTQAIQSIAKVLVK